MGGVFRNAKNKNFNNKYYQKLLKYKTTKIDLKIYKKSRYTYGLAQ